MADLRVAERVRMSGPLAVHVEGFEAELARLRFTPTSRVKQLRLMAHLSRWLDGQGLGIGALSPELVEAFRRERRTTPTRGCSHTGPCGRCWPGSRHRS